MSSLELVQVYISKEKEKKENEIEQYQDGKPVLDLGILITYLKEDIDQMLRQRGLL